LAPPGLDALDVVAEESPHSLVGSRAGQLEPSQVCDVEHPDSLSNGPMLGED
jgi:hypothetical protein